MENSPPNPTHERMTAIDQLLFQSERDPAHRTGGIGVYVLDKAPVWRDVNYSFEVLSREFLRFRQRVVEPTGGFGPAYWVVDPDFDIKFHVRRVQLPAGTTLRTVVDHLEIELMSPLELSRPLWYVIVYEGLEGGRSVLAMRASHAIGDGMGGQKMLTLLFDSTRKPKRKPMPAVPLARELTRDEVATKARKALPRAVFGSARGVASSVGKFGGRLIRHPKRAAAEVREFVRSMQGFGSSDVQPSPLLSQRSLSRRVIWIEVSLSELKTVSKSLGGSVNDGFLTALSGALGRYHEALGMPISRIPVTIPISIRVEGDQVGGNRFTHGLLEAPIGEPDPQRRLEDIREQILRARDSAHYDLSGMMARVFGYLPSTVIARVINSTTPPDIQASNVPGPRSDLYLAGARIEKTIGIGPVAGMAMMVGLTSHLDIGTVTVTYDPAAITDADLFHDCLEKALAELRPPKRRGSGPRSRRPTRARKAAIARPKTRSSGTSSRKKKPASAG